jgi:hypothetical protein
MVRLGIAVLRPWVIEILNFNRKERKVVAKNAKVNSRYSVLCGLCKESLRTLRLMDFTKTVYLKI